MGLIRLHVSSAAEKALRAGHPWLFEGSIRSQNRAGEAGELAAVYDRRDKFLALGLYDPGSPLRLRVLHTGEPVMLDDSWWRRRMQLPLDRRRALFGPETTGYRLLHGESDGWPGLVVDRYAETLVMKIYTAAWYPHLPRITGCLQALWPSRRLVLRLSRNLQKEGAAGGVPGDGTLLWGEELAGVPVLFQEHGLTFEAEVQRGQKTGFFLDQRENRQRVGELAAGVSMLNLFSFTGGFSVAAARGGAKSVVDLDISRHALTGGARHFELNRRMGGVALCRREAVKADAFAWLSQPVERRYGLVVVDPPSLARRREERQRALEAYGWLAERALARVAAPGHLVMASCSAQVAADEFFGVVRRAAHRSGRPHEVRVMTGQPEDHPADFPEARYLKCIYLSLRGEPGHRR